MDTLRAPRLVPGDRVRFVSPASPPNPDLVAAGVELLTSWGLPAGHGDNPPTIPIGTEATIDTAAGTLTVRAAVR
ncbi:hypothetical protein [Nonomuraea jabiensis]|uniref:Muramoyltetrapeptide carboxypeptidase LdcA involved in peptidoglycan recycling n=1 Tax=Nonomuraea jabiensis TaxID=882448 RepID=A0A7W9L8D4_9ACTN|nr:hypothetical protein [Nonomuraea jabiensis]MBB5774374.1 muramoyltetrapeptide carboxypeptidase LdcA involved in peptidoglycan recycling [Nonomuraea jabiensis]